MDFGDYANLVIGVLGAIVAVEQVLAQIPVLQSNSTFQLICNITNKAVEIGKSLFGPKVASAPPAEPEVK